MNNSMHPLMANMLSSKNLILLVSEESSHNFMRALNEQMSDPLLRTETGRVESFKMAMGFLRGSHDDGRAYATDGSTAVIPVHGSLVNRLNTTYGWVTGYAYIKSAISQALKDPDVENIVLDVNSNGGEAGGCWETAAFIKEASQQKPIHAIVDTNCHSAAYAIASAATTITATPTSSVGSIGVIAIHASLQGMYEEVGIKITTIQAGALKSLGSAYKDLSDSDKAIIQDKINATYDSFVSLVADNRNIDKESVIKTEAACYTSNQALTLGLIDRVETVEKAYSNLSTVKKEDDMALPENKENASASTTDNGAVAERQRIQMILSSEAGQNQPKLAQHLAFSTTMSAEEANGILEAAAADEKKEEKDKKSDSDEKDKKSDSDEKDKKSDSDEKDKKSDSKEKAEATGSNMLADAMAKIDNPNVGADNKSTDETADAAAEVAELAGLINGLNQGV